MEKWTFTKWLVTIGSGNELQITPQEVNRHIPINRMLDELGFFNFTFLDIYGKTYLVVYRYEEPGTKSKILVAKVDSAENAVVDMEAEDQENVCEIARRMMGYKPVAC